VVSGFFPDRKLQKMNEMLKHIVGGLLHAAPMIDPAPARFFPL
jgi:hypothetical protein